jgi:hypothetical protein
LWVLRSTVTVTLKTTATTLVSVNVDNGKRGALVHLPDASPETITEEIPSATVTPTQSRIHVARLDLGRDRVQDHWQVLRLRLAQEQTIQRCKHKTHCGTGLCKGCTQGL